MFMSRILAKYVGLVNSNANGNIYYTADINSRIYTLLIAITIITIMTFNIKRLRFSVPFSKSLHYVCHLFYNI